MHLLRPLNELRSSRSPVPNPRRPTVTFLSNIRLNSLTFYRPSPDFPAIEPATAVVAAGSRGPDIIAAVSAMCDSADRIPRHLQNCGDARGIRSLRVSSPRSHPVACTVATLYSIYHRRFQREFTAIMRTIFLFFHKFREQTRAEAKHFC